MLVDQDWDALLLDSGDPATTRAILRAFSDGIVNGAIGHQYHRLLVDAGFSDVTIEADAHASTRFDEYGHIPELAARGAEASGVLDSAATEKWLADQRDRGRRGRFQPTSLASGVGCQVAQERARQRAPGIISAPLRSPSCPSAPAPPSSS